MAECTSLQKSVDWCEGTPVPSGIKRRLYYINKKKILLWPTLTKNEIGQITATRYAGSFSLVAGARWKYIDVVADKSGVTSEPQGEYPSQTQLNKLTAFHPGTGKDATLLSSVFDNANNVFIVEDANGKFRVIGSEMYDSKVTLNQDLGQGASGVPSTIINVEATDVVPSPFYIGDISLESRFSNVFNDIFG